MTDPAAGDEVLFDAAAIIQTTRDVRSVGEMLADVDYLSRQLLMDVAGDDAAPLLRGWPQVVSAAAQVWRALPVSKVPTPGGSGKHMDRLEGLAVSIETGLRTGWPGAGGSDPRLADIVETLTRAARLVERYADEVPITRPAARGDVLAARVRIMHGLYVSTHAVNLALHEHGRDRYHDAREAGRPISMSSTQTPYAVAPTARWIRRMTVCERVAGRYVNGRAAKAFEEAGSRPRDDPARVERALTGWDIQAHRALASAPSPGDVLLAARAQVLIAGAGSILMDAAARADLLPPDATISLLLPAIDKAGRAWSNLASRWADLTGPCSRVDGNLARAATEVRAAFRELTHDQSGMASLEEIGTRPGLARAATAALDALDTGSDIACIVAEQVEREDLTGPARALSRRAHNDAEAGHRSPGVHGDDVVWVSPADILAERQIALPPPVLERLTASSAATIDASSRAAGVAESIRPEASPPPANDPAPRDARPNPGPGSRRRVGLDHGAPAV